MSILVEHQSAADPLRDHSAQRESKHITRRHADPVEKREDVRRHCVDCAGHRAGRAADAGVVEQDDFCPDASGSATDGSQL